MEILDKCIHIVGVLSLLSDNKICSSSVEIQKNEKNEKNEKNQNNEKNTINSIKIYKKTQTFYENKENGKMESKYEYNLEISLSEHKKPITSIIELDNCSLVAAARDGLIVIWKLIQSTMKRYDLIQACDEGVYSLCKLKDNKFASGDADGKIKLWKENDVINEKEDKNKYYCYQILNEGSQKTKIRCLILLNNNYLCSGDDDGNINIYKNINDERYEIYWTKNIEGESLTCLTYLNQGYLISSSFLKNSSKTFLRVWVPKNNGYERKETITKHYKPIRSVIELDWGNIVSAGEDGVIIIWKSGVLVD